MASTHTPAAAVQINVPISEPLIPELNPEHYQKSRAPFSLSQGKMQQQFVPGLSGDVLILAGPDSNSDYQKALLDLSEKIQAPILADPLSNLRNFSHPNIIDAYY
ncbi:hypothetical protein MJN17_23770, partial [Salmonella enterica subsp. enterica serovar Kentucky]|nr:hypothetical protein [Salmonella enterica subsp. enterica serovar Kentucky]